jgi:hypothetical protein
MTLHNRCKPALFVYESPTHGILHDAVPRSHHALIGQVMYQLPKKVDGFSANHCSLSRFGVQLFLCACIPTPVITESKDQALLF